jgi:hypothetical protein
MTFRRSTKPMPNAGALLYEGRFALIEAESAKDEADAGRLRGGSVGVVLDGKGGDGSIIVAGKCHRAAYARFLGATPPRDPGEWAQRQGMLKKGIGNEDAWALFLRASTWKGKVLREEEFPILWSVLGRDEDEADTDGSGREDIVLVDDEDAVVGLVELKAVCSFSTAKDVFLAQKPKTDHMIQAANYSYRTELPVQLWYTSTDVYALPSWGFVTKLVDDLIDDLRPYIKVSAKGEPSGIEPFEIGYELRWRDDGFLEYRCLLPSGPIGDWTCSFFGRENIERYYELIARMDKDRSLGPRPVALEPNGKKAGWSPCAYCDWKDVCDRTTDFDEWKSEVIAHRHSNQKRKEGA